MLSYSDSSSYRAPNKGAAPNAGERLHLSVRRSLAPGVGELGRWAARDE
jgi:hypothetical protein